MNAARDINAICLKRDVTHLNIIKKRGDVEIFLIGENESENVSQAVQLTTELNEKNKKHNVKIFVFSTKPSAAYTIDSVEYEKLLEHAVEHNCVDTNASLPYVFIFEKLKLSNFSQVWNA